MNIEVLREYCISKPGTTEGFPFDEHTLVFKVMNKMFAITSLDDFNAVNLKCDPELAEELRARYPEVKPGWHMNKHHWNTIDIRGSISDQQLFEWIDHSYDLIVKSLTKKLQAELAELAR